VNAHALVTALVPAFGLVLLAAFVLLVHVGLRGAPDVQLALAVVGAFLAYGVGAALGELENRLHRWLDARAKLGRGCGHG